MAGTRGRIGWFLVWAVVFCDIGTSVYYVPGILYGSTKDLAGVFVMLTLVAFVFLCVKEVEIARRFTEGGGVVTVASHAFSPLWGCAGGQLIIVDYLLTAAISATSGIYYIDSILGSWLAHHHLIVPTTIVFLLAFGVLNIIGIKESATVSAYLACSALAVNLIVVAVGLITSFDTVVAHIATQFSNLGHLPVKGALVGYAGAWLAFSGLESLSQIAPAMRDTHTTPRRGMVAVATTVILTAPLLTFLSTALLDPHLKSTEIERFISEVGFACGGWWLKLSVVLTASALLLFAANTAIIGNYHVQLALARHRFLPRWLGELSARFGTPHRAIMLSVVLPAIIVHLSGGDMGLLGDLYAFGLLGAFTLNSLGIDVLRWREGQRGPGFVVGVATSVMVVLAFVVNLFAKPKATLFGSLATAFGMIIALATSQGWWERIARRVPGLKEPVPAPVATDVAHLALKEAVTREWPAEQILVAVRGLHHRVLDEAALQVRGLGPTAAVILMYVDEVGGLFFPGEASPSPEGLTVLQASRDYLASRGVATTLIWDISHSAADSVAEACLGMKSSTVIVKASQRSAVWTVLRGRFIRDLVAQLPASVRLVVID